MKYIYLVCSFIFGIFSKTLYSLAKKYFYFKKIEISNIPKHVAIIMDGNGRWAKERGQIRTYGHKNSVNSVEAAIQSCIDYDIKYLTLYAFSTENWSRPKEEITEIFNLLNTFIIDKTDKIVKDNIKVNFLGDFSCLPIALQKNISNIVERTRNNHKLMINVCLNYSGRWDIITAINKILNNKNIDKIEDKDFINALSTVNIPDPDIIVRTGGDMRISNFLTWQSAYSELFFVKKYWPDFNENDFKNILIEYQKRDRRFGSIK